MTFLEQKAKRSYEAGEVIFQEHDEGSSMFILTLGEVEVSTVVDRQKVVLATLEKGAIFGEMSLIDGRTRSATVTAKRSSECLEISRMLFTKHMEQIPGWLRSFFQILVERLREANKHVQSLSDQDVSRQVIFGLKQRIRGEEPDLLDQVSISWKSAASDLAFLLNQPLERVERVMNRLSLTDLAKGEMNFEHGRQLVVKDVERFSRFADYCKARYEEKLGAELPPEYRQRSERETAVLKLFHDILREQSGQNEVEQHFLELRAEEELKASLETYRDELKLMRAQGVFDTRLNARNEKLFIVDRKRLESLLATSVVVKEFDELEQKV